MKYPVHEFFYTWQGEGVYLGRAAFFIRLYGCPVHCPWCDSAGTWHPEYVPKFVTRMLSSELVAAYLDATGLQDVLDHGMVIDTKEMPPIILTGGEPSMFDLEPLLTSFHEIGANVHIETSGAFPLRTGVEELDWVTVSPKWNKLPLAENLHIANEIKIIVEHKDSIVDWQWKIQEIIDESIDILEATIWLHPEWSKARDRDMEVLNQITIGVKMFPARYRAGYQMHKLYMADNLDPHSNKEIIPLGGDPERGI